MNKSNSIFKNILFITSVLAISKILGMVRNMIISFYFGISPGTDAYYLASGLIANVVYLLVSAIPVAFIPIYIKGKTDDLINCEDNFVGKMIISCLYFSVIIELLIICFSHPISYLLAPTFSKENQTMVQIFLCIITIGIMFILVNNLLINLLNAEKKYGFSAITAIINSVFVIIFIIITYEKLGIWSIAISGVASLIVQLIFLLIKVRKYINVSKFIFIPDKRVKKVFLNAAPLMISNSTIEINQLVDRILFGIVGSGVISAISYVTLFYDVAITLVVTPMNMILFTEITEAYISRKYNYGAKLLEKSISFIVYISLPIICWYALLSEDLVKIVFERGLFSIENTKMVSSVMLMMVISIIPSALKTIYQKVYYAMDNTKSPMKICIIEVGINISLSLIMYRKFGSRGILFATFIAGVVASILLIIGIQKTYFSLKWKNIEQNIAKIIIGNILLFVSANGTKMLLCDFSPVLRIIIVCGVSGIVYVVTTFIINTFETRFVIIKMKKMLQKVVKWRMYDNK